ncbi:MAG: hypothetical protein AAGL98_04420, partial [Planctomycetota bacterium]
MTHVSTLGGFAVAWGMTTAPLAALSVEPDDFEPGTELTTVSPAVTLNTEAPRAGDGGLRIVPNFAVTAAAGQAGFIDASPTGGLVFAHANVPFFNDTRVLRGDFAGVTAEVSLAFSPGSTLTPHVGRLEAYDFAGLLRGAVESAPLLAVSGPDGTVVAETLTIRRPVDNDIAFFRAYTREGVFGRFDALNFGAVTPVDVLPGDYNGDGFVSQADLDRVLLNWGRAVLPTGFNAAALAQPGPIWGFDGLV